MATSKSLYIMIEDHREQNEFSCDQSSETDLLSNGESRLISDEFESEQNNCEIGSCCGNVLASGKIFRFVTKCTGLWNPRKKPYGMLCAIFVFLNLMSLVAEIIIPSICGPFVDRCVTNHLRVTNGSRNDSHSLNRRNIEKIYEITPAFDAWNAFSDSMTFILLIYSVWHMQERLPCFSLAYVYPKLSSREWLVINVMWIIFSMVITVAIALRIAAVQQSKMKFYGTFGFGVLIVYLTAFTCCSVFAVLSCALGSLADSCLQEISTMIGGNLNDITDIHQKLCQQLATACRLLKPWFLIHWFMFGANCLVVFAFDSIHISLLSQQFSNAPTIFMAVSFVLNVMIFLLPCVYASRVTWKCDELLFKVNNLSSGHWKDGHPFRERATVNEFIFYVERSKCGFKIGNKTFGSSATWISVLLGLVGLGVKLVAQVV